MKYYHRWKLRYCMTCGGLWCVPLLAIDIQSWWLVICYHWWKLACNPWWFVKCYHCWQQTYDHGDLWCVTIAANWHNYDHGDLWCYLHWRLIQLCNNYGLGGLWCSFSLCWQFACHPWWYVVCFTTNGNIYMTQSGGDVSLLLAVTLLWPTVFVMFYYCLQLIHVWHIAVF